MTTNNNNTTSTKIANLLWEGSVEIVWNIASLIADLAVECKQDPKKMGVAIGNAWYQIGAEVEGGKPARLLLESCLEAKMDKKSVYALMNASEIVTKQRVTQLWQVVVEGDKSKNKGGKGDAPKGKRQDGLDKSEIPSWEMILEAIKRQPSITQAQAEAAAALLASKIKAA
jgi:hypothetical protein